MKIETKFNIGDEVFALYHNKAIKGIIKTIEPTVVDKPLYVINTPDGNQPKGCMHVFRTKEELIESLFN